MIVQKLTDARFDFPGPVPLRKSYFVASTHRNSDAFLCKSLWQSGILGAPWEYFNGVYNLRGKVSQPAENSILSTMMKRLSASSIVDYFSKLLDCRTSRNGVFGMKIYFDDFQAALHEHPEMLEILSPTTFIYVHRQLDLAHAVSVAKVTQKEASTLAFAGQAAKYRMRYDRDLISMSLGRLERRKLCWWRWFEKHRISPLVLDDGDISVDIDGIVQSVAAHLEVESDEADDVYLTPFAKEANDAEDKWVRRFLREIRLGINPQETESDDAPDEHVRTPTEPKPVADAGLQSRDIPGAAISMSQFEEDRAGAPNFALVGEDRDDRTSGDSVLGDFYPEPKYQAFDRRKLARYDEIITRNHALVSNARILDLMCADGLWCLAALDAGATHVVGVDPRANHVATANKILAECGVDRTSFHIVHSPILSALTSFSPEMFDLILCRRVLELFDPRIFFHQLRRLEPRNVIIDTDIVSGAGPIARYIRIDTAQSSSPSRTEHFPIVAVPSHEQINFLCDYFGFRWRLGDLQTLGTSHWNNDVGTDRGLIYVLERDPR